MGFRKVIIDCILHISYFTVYVLKISLVMYSRSKELVALQSSHPEKSLGKGVLKICRTPMPKCDINKVASNFIEIVFRHWCSPVNLLHIFRTPFLKNTSGWLLF